jgi:membrane protein
MSGRIEQMGRLMDSVPGRVIRRFLEDQAPNWAALIAWNALFALFPIVIFAASLLGFALRMFGEANDAVYKTIFSIIPGETQSELLKAVAGVKSQSGVLFIVGLVGLLWGGSALFGAMEQAFARIYHTKPRDFIQQKVVSFGMVVLFTLLAGLAVATSAILPALKHLPDIPAFLYSDGAGIILQMLVGIVAGFMLFASIYYVIPNRKQEFRKIIPGALVAGILFELITLVFPLYISLNRGLNQYGATFGLLFVLMTFLFFLGLVTMIGVEVNSVLYPEEVERHTRRDKISAAAKTFDKPRQRAEPQPEPSSNGARGPVRRGVRGRTALLLAVGASVVGILLGRRSANSD